MDVTGRDGSNGQPSKPSELIKRYTSPEGYKEALERFSRIAHRMGVPMDEAICLVDEVFAAIRLQEDTIDSRITNSSNALDPYIKGCLRYKVWGLNRREECERDKRRKALESGHFPKYQQPNTGKMKTEHNSYLLDLIRKSISLNPPKHPEIVLKYYLHGMKQEEIAKQCNVNIGTISRWIKAACKHIKKDLKERFGLDDWGNQNPPNFGEDDS